jgi:hypothetical protein
MGKIAELWPTLSWAARFLKISRKIQNVSKKKFKKFFIDQSL